MRIITGCHRCPGRQEVKHGNEAVEEGSGAGCGGLHWVGCMEPSLPGRGEEAGEPPWELVSLPGMQLSKWRCSTLPLPSPRRSLGKGFVAPCLGIFIEDFYFSASVSSSYSELDIFDSFAV